MFLLAIGYILAQIGKIVDKKYQQDFSLIIVCFDTLKFKNCRLLRP